MKLYLQKKKKIKVGKRKKGRTEEGKEEKRKRVGKEGRERERETKKQRVSSVGSACLPIYMKAHLMPSTT